MRRISVIRDGVGMGILLLTRIRGARAYLIDGGANEGLSQLYLDLLMPTAKNLVHFCNKKLS